MNPKIVLLSILAILTTFIVAISYYSISNRNKNEQLLASTVHFGVRMNSEDAEAKSQKAETFITERMKTMRDEMNPWAKAHSLMILTLIQSTNDIGISKTNMRDTPELSGLIRGFSWQIHKPKSASLSEEESPKILKDYKFHQDIVISSAVCAGNINIELWLSGRITKITLGEEPINGAYQIVERNVEEIAPRYDFLDINPRK
jgi:hypothetical protein